MSKVEGNENVRTIIKPESIDQIVAKSPEWRYRRKGSLLLVCYGDPEFGSKRLSPPSDGLLVEYLGKVRHGDLEMPIEAARRPVGYGKVLAVGPGRKTGSEVIPCDTKVGDEVLYYYANATVMGVPDDNGVEHEYVKINETQVLATFKNQ